MHLRPQEMTNQSRLTFEKPELKMIIDAVMAANFISASKCQQLVEKLMSLAGENAKNQYPENGCPDTLIRTPCNHLFPPSLQVHILKDCPDHIGDRFTDCNHPLSPHSLMGGSSHTAGMLVAFTIVSFAEQSALFSLPGSSF